MWHESSRKDHFVRVEQPREFCGARKCFRTDYGLRAPNDQRRANEITQQTMRTQNCIPSPKRMRLSYENDVFVAKRFTNCSFSVRRDDDHRRTRVTQTLTNTSQHVDYRRLLANHCYGFWNG